MVEYSQPAPCGIVGRCQWTRLSDGQRGVDAQCRRVFHVCHFLSERCWILVADLSRRLAFAAILHTLLFHVLDNLIKGRKCPTPQHRLIIDNSPG